jgi:hypothetical protein
MKQVYYKQTLLQYQLMRAILIMLLITWSTTNVCAQSIVTGKVKDKQTGDFLTGATISVQGTSIRATTNAEGAVSTCAFTTRWTNFNCFLPWIFKSGG